ncbi:MAG: TolC family protein [Bacteroidota bacterium]
MKRKFLKLLTVTASLYCFNVTAQTGATLNLQQSVETALTNNLTVKQNGLQSQSAEANLKQARATRLPVLNIDIIHGINQGRSIDPFTNSYLNQQINFANYGANASITLFNGNNITNNIKRNIYNVEATKMDLQQSKDIVTLNVILAYLDVLSNEDQLKQNYNQASLSRQQVERLEIMNKGGAIPPAQLYDLKGQLANDELAIVSSQNALDAAKLTLAQLMNIPYDSGLHVQPVNMEQELILYDATTQMIYESASKNLGYVKATGYRKQSAEKAVQAAKGLLYPSVYLATGLYTNYSSAANIATLVNSSDVPSGDYVSVGGDKVPVITTRNNYQNNQIAYFNQFKNNYNASISIGVRIPILNALQIRTQVKQAKINLTNANYVEETTKLQLLQDIEKANFNMLAAFKRYQKLKEQVAAFQESFRAADIRFNAGVINSVEYLVVKTNLDRSNINLIIAQYEYLLRTKVLDYYQGKPLW